MNALDHPDRGPRGGGTDALTITTHRRTALAGLAMLAGVIHLWVTSSHFAEWWGYGLFFALVALTQVAYGGLWLILDLDAGRIRALGAFGIVLHVLLLGLYAVTRTLGIPLVGPGAGHVEPVGAVDVVSKLVELGLTGMLAGVIFDVGVRSGGAHRPGAGS